MKLFSIIVPIYNVEEYIEKCFNNIYSQGIDEDDFEIIAVNDGTPDDSMKHVEKFQEKHDNITIVNKSNGGVSSARNTGIGMAAGKYLLFLDPDDYFATNSLSSIRDDAEQQECDIFVLRSMKSNGMAESYRWQTLFADRYTDIGKEIYKKGYTRGSVCGCLFKKEFINRFNIRFYEKVRNCEDTIFFFLSQMHAESIMFLDKEFYIVYERENSASRSFSEEKMLMMFNNLEYVQQYAAANRITDETCIDMLETLKYLLISNLTYFSICYKGSKSLQLLKQHGITRYLPKAIKYGAISYGTNRLYRQLMSISFTLYYYLRLFKHK